MNNFHKLGLSALLGLFCLSTTTNAAPMTPMGQDNNAPAPNYLGASLGLSNSDDFCEGLSRCDEAGRTWKIYSGVRMTDKILIEGGYVQFGKQSGNNGTEELSSSVNGYTTAGVATYALGNDIDLFGKAGMLWWKKEQSTAGKTTETDGRSVFMGAGASYDLGDNMGVRAEWERFEGIQQSTSANDKKSMDLISVGLTFSSL